MKNDSINMIPSFESIPLFPKQPYFLQNQMKFIGSKFEINSYKSLDDNIKMSFIYDQRYEEASIGHIEDGSQNPEDIKNIVATNENIKTPSKKRKDGCVCKKTGCLKLYCQCFKLGKACSIQCNCCNCENTVQNKGSRIVRKGRNHTGRQKKACNCKKSQCLKKYCECFNSGLKCGQQCKCESCFNIQAQVNI